MSGISDHAQKRDFVGAHGLALTGFQNGPDEGLPVILSHGGGQTRHAWGRSAHVLAQHGFRAIALDLRGHGDSAWSVSGLYPIEDYAEDLRLIMTALGRPAILVGASLGGMASLLAAADPPPVGVAGVCLVDVSPHLLPEGVEGILGFMRATQGGFDTVAEAAQAIASYLPHRPRPTDLAGLEKILRKSPDGRYAWHWDPRIIEFPLDPAVMNPMLEAAARRVPAKAILLRGELSELVTHNVATDFMGLFRDGSVVDVEGARHMVAGDRNDLFGQRLLEFAVAVRDETRLKSS